MCNRSMCRLLILVIAATVAMVNAQQQTTKSVTFLYLGPDIIAQKTQLQPASAQDRVVALRQLFATAECGPRVFEQPVADSVPTVACTTRATSDAEIVVLAPTDYTIKSGDEAALRWADLVMLPALAQSMGSLLTRHKFVFVAVGGKNNGEQGAAEYLKQLPETERKKIDVVIGFDHLGRALPIYDSPNIKYDYRDLDPLGAVTVRQPVKQNPLLQSIVLSAHALNLPVPTLAGGTTAGVTKPFAHNKIETITFASPEEVVIRTLSRPDGRYPVTESRKKFDAKAYHQTYMFLCAYLLNLDRGLGQALPAPSEKIAQETLAADAAASGAATPAANPANPAGPATAAAPPSSAATAPTVAQAPTSSAPPVASPAAQAQPAGQVPVFQATSRLVQLDVVVTDKSGTPIRNLRKEDFAILQDGRPQVVHVFEAHDGSEAAEEKLNQPSVAEVGTNTYSNMPAGNLSQAKTILFFDEWNTPLQDQQIARNQLKKVAKQLPKGQPVALFVLNERLMMTQPFTSDPEQILTAINKLPLRYPTQLTTEAQRQQDMSLLANAYVGASGQAASISTLGRQNQDYEVEESQRLLIRNLYTLQAFGALGRSVAGYPGRKNVIWLSGSFPAVVMAQPGTPAFDQWKLNQDFKAEVAKMSSLLASARIAVYPVDIRGMQTRGADITAGGPTSVTFAGGDTLTNQFSTAAAERDTMENVAAATGGRAYINTNDFGHAITRAMQDGATYYTIAYTPESKDERATYHNIRVKLDRPDVQLAYRQGYYSRPEPESKESGLTALRRALQPGTPPATMLIFKATVNQPDKNPGALEINYTVNGSNITLADGPNGNLHVVMDFIAVAFDKDGKEVTHALDTLDGNVPAATLDATLRQGIPAMQELDLKPGVYNVRVGVMDRESQRMGTLEMPVIVR
jgi:VWFA-related protein